MSTQPLVLVADDERRITKLVSMALSDEGFRVVTASCGEEALAKAEEIRPDIVLLDIVMPEQGGQDTLRQILAIEPRATVAMISSLAGDDVVNECMQLGAKSYLKKPFTKDGLLELLRKLVGAQ